MMRRRLLLIQQSTPVLPDEYQQILWIQAEQGAYIDINYISDVNTSAKLIYELTANASGQTGIFGINFNGCFKAEIRYATRWYCATPTKSIYYPTTFDNTGNIANQINTMIFNNQGVILNGVEDYRTRVYNPTIWNHCYLFGLNNNNTLYESKGTIRVYSLQFFQNNNISLDFIPCYRKADNVPGFYDLINRVFYTNAGTNNLLIPT